MRENRQINLLVPLSNGFWFAWKRTGSIYHSRSAPSSNSAELSLKIGKKRTFFLQEISTIDPDPDGREFGAIVILSKSDNFPDGLNNPKRTALCSLQLSSQPKNSTCDTLNPQP